MSASTNSEIRFWDNPPAHALGSDYVDFLHRLGQPTWIRVTGRDRSRARAIVTLLHGNEPSGLKAVHRYLLSGETPATDTVFVIAAVDAALAPPTFSHRFLPHEQDLNRCFGGPASRRDGGTEQERLADALLGELAALAPEVVIDIHNTSSHSVPFAVVYHDTRPVWQVTRQLTDKLVIITRPLGTLIEQTIGEIPIVTLEVGGIFDAGADELAWQSLRKLVSTEDLFDAPDHPVLLLPDPIRLELKPGFRICYASTAAPDYDLTLPNTIDQLNFACVSDNTPLGWLGAPGLEMLSARDGDGSERITDLFREEEGVLTSNRRMTLFMVTTDSSIAENDCILYLVPER